MNMSALSAFEKFSERVMINNFSITRPTSRSGLFAPGTTAKEVVA